MAEPEHQTPAPAEQAIRSPGGGPSLVPVPFRAADGLVAFLAAADVERRADVTLAMQRTSGNRAVTRMLQRDPLDDVKKVRSFEVEEKQAGQATLQKQLDRRLQKRRDEITAALAETKNEARKTALSHDLAKTLDDIIKTPDAKGINPELRADIIESATRLGKATATAQSAQQAWSQFDDVFADADVEKTLAGIGLTPADLKALIARESGDLVQNPQGPGIAGIAQIGVDEEKRAGGSPGDRKQPRLAIPLAAKVLVDTAADLKKALKTVPKGDDWKKFLFAAYNAGVFAIAAAQAAAETGDTWADLVKGGESSPLFTGLKKFYGSKAKTKFSEVMNHVNGIFARLAPAP